MEQTWTYRNSQRTAPISSGVQLFVDLIGIDKTADLILACGGSLVAVGQYRSKSKSLVVDAIGEDAARLIGHEFFGGNFKCPLGKPFLIRYLFAKGANQSEIARKLRIDVSNVTRNLKGFHPSEEIEDRPLHRRRKP